MSVERGVGACTHCGGYVREVLDTLACVQCGREMGQLRPGARPTALLQKSWAQIAREAAKAERARATHCRKGHPYTRANTRLDKNGWRVCRACAREAGARRRARRLTEAGG